MLCDFRVGKVARFRRLALVTRSDGLVPQGAQYPASFFTKKRPTFDRVGYMQLGADMV